MKLKTHHDLDVGNHILFAGLANPTRWERAALRKGIEVTRLDAGDGLVPGAAWQIAGMLKGKLRVGHLKLRAIEEAQMMLYDFETPMFLGVFSIRLLEMSARRTRIALEVEVRPRTLAGRIILQGARLGRQKMEKRFHQRSGIILNDLISNLRAA